MRQDGPAELSQMGCYVDVQMTERLSETRHLCPELPPPGFQL